MTIEASYEKGQIKKSIDPEDLKRLAKYNSTTKEFDTSPELPSIIKKLILVKNGTEIDLSKL